MNAIEYIKKYQDTKKELDKSNENFLSHPCGSCKPSTFSTKNDFNYILLGLHSFMS